MSVNDSVTELPWRRHFGIHIDSDESDLDVPSEDEWTDSGKLW